MMAKRQENHHLERMKKLRLTPKTKVALGEYGHLDTVWLEMSDSEAASRGIIYGPAMDVDFYISFIHEQRNMIGEAIHSALGTPYSEGMAGIARKYGNVESLCRQISPEIKDFLVQVLIEAYDTKHDSRFDDEQARESCNKVSSKFWIAVEVSEILGCEFRGNENGFMVDVSETWLYKWLAERNREKSPAEVLDALIRLASTSGRLPTWLRAEVRALVEQAPEDAKASDATLREWLLSKGVNLSEKGLVGLFKPRAKKRR